MKQSLNDLVKVVGEDERAAHIIKRLNTMLDRLKRKVRGDGSD